MKRIILASASPRRREILSGLQMEFEVMVSDLDESLYEHLMPKEMVLTLSIEKAKRIQSNLKNCMIIAADTIVVLDNIVFGKPKSTEQAFGFLKQLSGRAHEVYTGISIIDLYQDKIYTDYCITQVEMEPFSDEEIMDYVQTGEPMDKAGAYALQGIGGIFVKKIEGDYTNVVGLPVSKLYEGFRQLGYSFFKDIL